MLEDYDKLLKIYNELENFNIEEFGKIKIYVKLNKPETDGTYETYNKIIDIDNVNKN